MTGISLLNISPFIRLKPILKPVNEPGPDEIAILLIELMFNEFLDKIDSFLMISDTGINFNTVAGG